MPQASGSPDETAVADAVGTAPLVLHRAVRALDAAGARWALLRGELGDDVGDVDLLVHPADLAAAEAALADQGYARWPSWGRGSHRFHLAYDGPTDAWVKLDLVTELAFGPYGELVTPAAADVLARRRRPDGAPAPALAVNDGFWALLLHCLLDRGTVAPRHLDALRQAAAAGDVVGGPLLASVAPALPPVEALALAQAAAEGDVASLEAAGSRLRARWVAVDRTGGRRRRQGRLARRAAPVPVALGRRGMTVALLGPDGAGKSTLAAALVATPHLRARSLYAGLYGAAMPQPRLPVPGLGLATRLARLWRLRLRAATARARGRVVVFDRHGLDAAATARPARGAASRARRRLLAAALPTPDLLVVLDAPAPVLLARKGEHDVPALEAQRERYRALAERLGGVLVDAGRDAESVRRDVTELVWRRWTSHWSAR
jgi:thymidylate kinase